MSKKKEGKSKGFVSEGKHSNVSRKTRTDMKRSVNAGEKLFSKYKAWLAGKKVKITIENPDKTQTNRQYITVSGDEYFGKGRPAKDIQPFIIRGSAVPEEA